MPTPTLSPIPARTVFRYSALESTARETREAYVARRYTCSPVRYACGSWSFAISVPANDNSI